jgi:nucleotide-binding universal stress UspA family protein
VADKIIHETDVPVWLVPSHLSESILTDISPQRYILIPLDGSKLAENIIPYVKALIKQRDAETEIFLVSSINIPVIAYSDWTSKAQRMGEDLAAQRAASEAYLNGLVSALKAEGFIAQAKVLTGDPAEEIVKFAGEIKPRLIAMSTHGKSGLNRFIFGGVAENVLRRLQRTPLFLVKPTE